jgi:hypothetical protein
MPSRFLLPLLAVLLLLVATTPAGAQSRLTGFDLLRVTPSARGAALAGSYSPGAAPSPDAMFYNPAFLTEETNDLVALGYLNHLADVWMGFAAYTRHVEQLKGTMGVAVRHLNFGSFDRTTYEGTTEGTFGASETALTLSYARPLSPGLEGGASLHAAYVALEDVSASALAADVGVAYAIPAQGMVLSAALRNVGIVLSSLGATPDQLPVDLRASVSKRLENLPLRLTLTGYDLTRFEGQNGSALNEVARHLALSGEFQFGQALAVRLGYDHRTGEELRTGQRLDLAGLGLGFGLDLRRFGFDYAYNTWSAFGGLHHLTVRARL